jgi:hypothetical protein
LLSHLPVPWNALFLPHVVASRNTWERNVWLYCYYNHGENNNNDHKYDRERS